MSGSMSTAEVWVAIVLAVLSFTGLYVFVKETGEVLRVSKPNKRPDAVRRLRRRAQGNGTLGLVLAVLTAALFFAGVQIPRAGWLLVAAVLLHALWLNGAGRRSADLQDYPAPWVLRRHVGDTYEGYDESALRLPRSASRDAEQLFLRAEEKEREGDYDAALRLHGKTIDLDPGFAKSMTSKGILHCMQGDPIQGRNLFLKASELCSDSAFIYHCLARVEKQMGLFEESQQHEKRARHNLSQERTDESTRQHPDRRP